MMLMNEELTFRMCCHCRHTVHMWLGDVLDHHRDIEIPGTDRFVIRRRDEPPVVVDEGDRVHGTQVLVVLLSDLARVHVVLPATLARVLSGK
jgi:hypothetical protein